MTTEIKQVDRDIAADYLHEVASVTWEGAGRIRRGEESHSLIELLATQRSTYEARIAELERQILIQKNAARTIMHCEGDELRRLREQAREHHVAIQTLDSERAANARLTDELAAAEARLAEAVEVIRPFVRHGRALGAYSDDPGPYWIMDNTGHRDVPAEDFRRAARFIQETERG